VSLRTCRPRRWARAGRQNLSLTFPPTLAAATYTARVEGVAPIDGGNVTRSAPFKLKVTGAVGATTAGVAGRFVDPQGRGIAGVIIRAEDAEVAGSNLAQTSSDAGGNFLFLGLPPTKITLRIDATPANPGFPIWPFTLMLEAGKITPLSEWTLQPPPRDETVQTAARQPFGRPDHCQPGDAGPLGAHTGRRHDSGLGWRRQVAHGD
jgi:hypothetical protein